MSTEFSLRSPELLHIHGNDRMYYGGVQTWYKGFFQRMGGCGPTTASHLVWYIAQAVEGCAGLCAHEAGTRKGFLRLMEDMWRYVTPGFQGVNSTALFVKGVTGYGRDHGVPLDCAVLDVPKSRESRPSVTQVAEFLKESFEADSPVAFLNLDNGQAANLDKWHWVTIVGYEERTSEIAVYDQGNRLQIDLALWLRTSSLGGGFVYARPIQ